MPARNISGCRGVSGVTLASLLLANQPSQELAADKVEFGKDGLIGCSVAPDPRPNNLLPGGEARIASMAFSPSVQANPPTRVQPLVNPAAAHSSARLPKRANATLSTWLIWKL